MDAISPKILSSLVIRSVTGSVGAARAARQSARIISAVKSLQAVDSDASRHILSVIAELHRSLGHRDAALVAKFLKSPEADVFVRSTAIALMTREYDTSKNVILDELIALLTMNAGLRISTAQSVAAQLIVHVPSAIQRVTGHFHSVAPQDYGRLVDRAMHEKNAGYLRNLTHRADIFRQRTPGELRDILQFLQKYREQVHHQSSELIPAYFDIQRRAPIELIYVSPRIRISTQSRGTVELDFRGLVENVYRPVVLGDPGAGKSTLAQRIAYYFAGPEAVQQHFSMEVAPIVVPLRLYESFSRERPCTIPEFMAELIADKYHLRVPANYIEHLLATGRAVVVFDGLDELLDLGRRQHICFAVESFAALFANVPIVTTSRRVGYLESPLQPALFSQCELLPFTEDDVEQYATAWFSLDERLTDRERAKLSETFLQESLSVQDIRSNALMLGLLCNVYKGSREIPQNRAELYEKCAVMLFEQWDVGRGIARLGVLKADARAALQDVALWIYTTEDLADGVPEKLLLRRLQKYWMRRYEDPQDALDAARRLLKTWRGRSWILTDVGSSAERKEAVYKFTHQTFLEYFASVELAKRNPTPKALWKILDLRLRVGLWDIIAQLAIQRLNDFMADAGDTICQLLVKSASESSLPSRISLLSFAARNLDSLYPTTTTTRKLAAAAVDVSLLALPSMSDFPEYWEDYLDESLRLLREDDNADEIVDLFGDDSTDGLIDLYEERGVADVRELIGPLRELAGGHGEPGRIARDEVARHLEKLMTDTVDLEAGARAFVTAASARLLLPHDVTETADSLQMRLSEVIERLASPAKINEWAESNFWVPIVACRLSLIHVDSMAESLGWRSLFSGAGAFGDTYSTFAEQCLASYLHLTSPNRASPSLESTKTALSKIGKAAQEHGDLRIDFDWLGLAPSIWAEVVQPVFLSQESDEEREALPRETDRLVATGAAVALAAFFELEKPNLADYSEDQIAELRLGPIRSLESVYVHRRIKSIPISSDAVKGDNVSSAAYRTLQAWAENRHDIIAID